MMVFGFVLAVLLIGVAVAQSGYQILGHTFSAGGVSSGSGYTVTGTAGQAGAQALTGSGYVLTGGFVPSASEEPDAPNIFLPLVQR
jgi:hypothetical protein